MNRTNLLRAAYLAAAAATCGVGWLLASGRLFDFVFSLDGGSPAEFTDLFVPMQLISTGPVVVLLAAFLWLARRPRWWGKLLCAWAGLSWTGFSPMARVVAGFEGHAVPPEIGVLPLVCGLTVLAVGVLHQVLEPGFGAPKSAR